MPFSNNYNSVKMTPGTVLPVVHVENPVPGGTTKGINGVFKVPKSQQPKPR